MILKETTHILAVIAVVVVTQLDDRGVSTSVTDPSSWNVILIWLHALSYWTIFTSILISLWNGFMLRFDILPNDNLQHIEYLYFSMGVICYTLKECLYFCCLYGDLFTTDPIQYIAVETHLWVAYLIAYISPVIMAMISMILIIRQKGKCITNHTHVVSQAL